MPRLKQINPQATSPDPAQAVTFANAGAFQGPTRGLMALSRGLDQVGESLKQVQEYKDKIYLAKTTAELRNRAQMQYLKAKETAPDGAPGFAKERLREFDKTASEITDDAPFTVSKALKARVEMMRGDVQVKALGFEVTARMRKRVADVEDTIRLNANAIVNDPSQAENALAETKTAIEALPLPGDQKRKLIDKAEETFAGASLISRIEEQPEAVRDELTSGKWDARISPSTKVRLLNRARAVIKREQDKKKREEAYDIKRRADNDIVRAQRTGQPAGEFDYGRAVEVLGKRRADELRDRINRETDLHWETQRMIGMSKDEIVEYVRGKKPNPSSQTLAKDQKDYGRLVETAEKIIKQRNDDPAGYVLRNYESIRAGYENIGADQPDFLATLDPENTNIRAQAGAMLEAQKRLGIPKRARTVLPKRAAQRIASQLASEADPTAVSEQIQNLANAYGEHWGVVFRQLQEAGNLPTGLRVAMTMTREDQDLPRAALVKALKQGEKAYDETLEKEDRDAFKDQTVQKLDRFRDTLRGQGQDTKHFNEIAAGVRLLAKEYHARGESIGDAIDKAIEDVIGKAYEIDGNLRIPKVIRSESGEPVPADTKAIVSNLSIVLGNVDKFRDKVDLDRYPSPDPALTDEARRDAAWRSIKGNIQFVPSETEQGVYLHEPTGPLVDKDGNKLFIPWAALNDPAKLAEVMRNRFGITLDEGLRKGRGPADDQLRQEQERNRMFSPTPGTSPEQRGEIEGDIQASAEPASLRAEIDTTNLVDPEAEGYTEPVETASVAAEPRLRPRGVKADSPGFVAPLDSYTRISSNFGMRRHPILKATRMHTGMDFAAPTGSPVKSVLPGTVVRAGWFGSYGNFIEVEHSNGVRTRYAHLSAINVKQGAKVTAGALLGKVGSTGRSTGPHLHFEVVENGRVIDPRKLIGDKL